MNESHARKDCWDKWSVGAKVFASIVTPVIILFSGLVINSNLKEKELKVQYTEIAVDILRQKPSSDSKAMRDWAIDVFKAYSPIPIKNTVESDLREKALPVEMSVVDFGPNGVVELGGVRKK